MSSPNLHAPANDTVSQSEIERLLQQVESCDPSAGGATGGAASGRPFHDGAPRFDFPQLSFFSVSELRKLRVLHEEFILSLAARLSMHLGLEVSLQMAKLETLPFKSFVEGLSNPTHLTLLKIEPLRGTCLLDIPSRLALCIVDRELGGIAVCHDDARELNKMEARLVSRVVENIVNEWCTVWSKMLDLRPILVGHENNGRFLEICPATTMMLILGVETKVGETVEQMQFAFPHYTLEPLMLKLNAGAAHGDNPGRDVPAAAPKWNSALDEARVEISAGLPEVEVTAGQLAQLKPGDVLQMPRDAGNRIEVRLADHPKYLAHLGTSEGRWAVKIERKI